MHLLEVLSRYGDTLGSPLVAPPFKADDVLSELVKTEEGDTLEVLILHAQGKWLEALMLRAEVSEAFNSQVIFDDMEERIEMCSPHAIVHSFNACLTKETRLALFDFACKLDPFNELRLFVYESKKEPLEMRLADFEATVRKVMAKTKLFSEDAL